MRVYFIFEVLFERAVDDEDVSRIIGYCHTRFGSAIPGGRHSGGPPFRTAIPNPNPNPNPNPATRQR